MEAQNILYGSVNDLKELHTILEKQINIGNNISAMNIDKQRLEKEAQTEEKLMHDNIDFTIKKRREQIVANFDNEMIKYQDKLKKVRNERGKEKDKKMALRIKEETKDLGLENKNIKEEYRTYMKQKGISTLWDNKLFFSVFYPRTPLEMLILMAFMVAVFIGIPILICTGMGSVHAFFKVIVVLIFLIFAVGTFAFVYRFARDDYKQDFLEVRKKQALIGKNNYQIAKIKKEIKKDKNEERYELHDFDKEIKEFEDTIADIVKRKNNALDDFEKTTSVEIRDEIYNKDITSIRNKKDEAANLANKIKEYEALLKECALEISTNYTAYLGEENMSLEKIEKLIVIMGDGRASTVSEAITIMNAPQ